MNENTMLSDDVRDERVKEGQLVSDWKLSFRTALKELGFLDTEEVDVSFPRDINGNLNVDYLRRINETYGGKERDVESPLPNLSFNSKELTETRLKSLGYQLGEADNLGFCYPLMSDLDFATGYWIAQTENSLTQEGTLSQKVIDEISSFYGNDVIGASDRTMMVISLAYTFSPPSDEKDNQK